MLDFRRDFVDKRNDGKFWQLVMVLHSFHGQFHLSFLSLCGPSIPLPHPSKEKRREILPRSYVYDLGTVYDGDVHFDECFHLACKGIHKI